MLRLPRNPRFWLGAFIVWLASLWALSANPGAVDALPLFPHADKIAHFGYFFGGSGLLCAFLFRRRAARPDWRKITVTAVLILGAIGLLDEYHQTFTPGRSGNDPFDFLADLCGATAGAFVFKLFHRWIQ